MKRIDWLDGARAYAIAGVILIHTANAVKGLPEQVFTLTRFGQYGVQFFFAISALTVLMTLRQATAKSEPVRSWLTKRFFRIAPLYYTAIAIYAIVDISKNFMGIPLPPDRFSVQAIISNITFTHSLTRIGNNTVVPGGWSIGVEMAFYAISAVLLRYITRENKPSIALLYTSAILITVINFAIHPNMENNSFEYFYLPTQLPVLMLSLAIWISQDPTQSLRLDWRWTAFLLAFGVPGALVGPIYGTAHALAPVLFGLFFAGILRLASTSLLPMFSNSVAKTIGSLSFSIYICHFAVRDALSLLEYKVGYSKYLPPTAILAIDFVAILCISTFIASISKRIIEDPGISLGRALSDRISAKSSMKKQPM